MTDIKEDPFTLGQQEGHFIISKYVVSVPLNDKLLATPQGAKKLAAKVIKAKIGDEVEVSAVVVKKPSVLQRAIAKRFHNDPRAHLLVTTKF